jgi:hypothetical protein
MKIKILQIIIGCLLIILFTSLFFSLIKLLCFLFLNPLITIISGITFMVVFYIGLKLYDKWNQ